MTDAAAPRWRGQPGRLEVWYATFTDPVSGAGCWLHYEVVAPIAGDPFAHGWAAVFQPGSTPSLRRFDGAEAPWDVKVDAVDAKPLYTFPHWAWEREVLPGAQVVTAPTATFTGTVDGHSFDGARGATAHIYGHGNAERWVWLHADLGGRDALEIVSAVSRRPGLRRISPLALVQLRLDGRDWPRDPLMVAPLFTTRVDGLSWQVRGSVGRHRLNVDVTIPTDRAVQVAYCDPDGATATCTNSAIADAHISYSGPDRDGWQRLREWHLAGTAHAEVGTRP